MEGRVGDVIDTSRQLDTTTMDMKQSFQHKTKEAKKFAKVKIIMLRIMFYNFITMFGKELS